MKKVLSWILVFALVYSTTPWPSEAANAADGQKPSIVVMDFTVEGGHSLLSGKMLTDRLRDQLSRLGKFKVPDRAHIDTVLARKGLNNCRDESCLTEIGKALSADVLVTGKVTESQGKWVVSLTLINFRTSRIEHVTTEAKLENLDILSEQFRRESIVADAEDVENGGATVKLRVITSPRKASVYIDDKFVGNTPLELELAAGKYWLRVEKKGYDTVSEQINVRGEFDNRWTTTMVPTHDPNQSQFVKDAKEVGIFFGIVLLGVVIIVGPIFLAILWFIMSEP